MTEEIPSGYSANPASRDNWKSVDYWEKPIHKWQHEVPKMPWHSDDKPFGVSQEEWDERRPRPEPEEQTFQEALSWYMKVREFDDDRMGSSGPIPYHEFKCACGNPAVVMGRYCLECWENGDDEDE